MIVIRVQHPDMHNVSYRQPQDIMVSGFSNPPVHPHHSSRYSRDSRYSFGYASSRLRYSFDATSMAASSLLYRSEPSAPVIFTAVANLGAAGQQEKRPLLLSEYCSTLASAEQPQAAPASTPPQTQQHPFYGQLQGRGILLDRVSEGLSDHPPSTPAPRLSPPRVPPTGQLKFSGQAIPVPRPSLSWWQRLTTKRGKGPAGPTPGLLAEEPSVRRRQAMTLNVAHDASVRRGQALLASRLLPQNGVDLLSVVPELGRGSGLGRPSCDSRGSWGGLGPYDLSEGWSNPGGESNAGGGASMLAQDSRKPGGGFIQEALELSGTMPWCISSSSSQLTLPQQQRSRVSRPNMDPNSWARS